MKEKMKQWISHGGMLGLVALGAVIVMSTFAPYPTSPNRKDIAKAQRQETPSVKRESGKISGLGVIEPKVPESKLAPGVGGRLAKVFVAEGDQVKAGQELAHLENDAERANVKVAEAELAAAQARFARSKRGMRPEEIEAVSAELESAEARSALSQGVFERLTSAETGGGVSRDELERARQDALAARAQALSVEARKRAAGSGRREDIQLALAETHAAEARLALAKANLERTVVRAPLDGTILEVHYRVGEYVQPSSAGAAAPAEPLLVMGDLSEIHARIDIDERDIGQVHVGQAAWVELNGYPGKKFNGTVVEVAKRMGRKNIRSDEPTERIDTKILEVVLKLNPEAQALMVGSRVLGWIASH